ncbi:nuclear transport factor 2 family protein [Yinghuangia soli]|uniref:Nuclear transport factor 2 family protein n=1 Tax=Yinghuangia soli TaxID=2908204 RepID=A0AA41PYG7_9ACTN|nr:nuclear transport factor 2 family protein [Yinghuangia soli]MCF2527917.1 nuclear transport factor 2 family protein [Yinghuangia soli]
MPAFVPNTNALSADLDSELVHDVVRELRDRAEIADALLRFGLGVDERDPDVFTSAFTPDAVFDFRPVAERLGLEIPVMDGFDAILAVHFNDGWNLDTTHSVTNVRIAVDGDEARLTAIVEAQHLPKHDHSRHLLLKNRYDVELVRTGSGWAMRHLLVKNVWFTGEPKVLAGE